MKKSDNIIEFLKIQGLEPSDNPEEVSIEIRRLGISLIFEELEELAEASGVSSHFASLCSKSVDKLPSIEELQLKKKVDVVEQADALGDVDFTLNWCINMFGHRITHNEVFREICISNNSKACHNMEEAQATVDFYMKTKGVESTIIERDGKFVVERLDGKLLKNVNYYPANIERILENNK